MEKINVRVSDVDEMMTIAFKLAGKTRNMNRPKDEAVEKPLTRIRMSLLPKPDKKSKRNKGAPDVAPQPSVDVTLYRDEDCAVAVPSAEPNITAWADGAVLAVGSQRFKVVVNPPYVAKLSVHARAMAGFPLLPAVVLDSADPDRCVWLWERLDASGSSGACADNGGGASVEDEAPDGAVVGSEMCYTPSEADVGHLLRVTCTPARGDLVSDPVSFVTDVVELGPQGEGERRWQLTAAPPPPPQLRVVTYNILADQYASMEYSRAVLFKHVRPASLDVEYRKQLVLRQLLRYNADILCLQEVDRKVFEAYLLPHLSRHGYDGIFTCKVGQVQEGSSLFYRKSRLSLRARRDVDLPAVFSEPLDAIHAHFQPMLAASPHLRDALSRVTTIGQLAVLRDSLSGEHLALVNTHLFFHGDAPHIRTMHAAALVAELQALVAQTCGGAAPAVMFCGDLNSDLDDGVPGALTLLQEGRLGADFWDWAWGADFSFGRDEDARDEEIEAAAAAPEAAAPATAGAEVRRNTTGVRVTGVDLTIPYRFESSDGLRTPWTNYVPGYQGLLDYIWCDTARLRVHANYPPPDADELGSFLPNEMHPSDHLAVVADVSIVAAAADGAAALSSARDDAAAGPNGAGDGARAGGVPAGSAAPENGSVRGSGAEARPEEASSSGQSLPGGGRVVPASDGAAAAAARLLLDGGVIAVPTDTLYGLAARGDCWEAITRIYAVKGRDFKVPLAIVVASVAQVATYGATEHLPPGLVAALLPGPVTVVLTRRGGAPLAANLNPGVATIGVRVPDCGFMQQVCENLGSAAVLTSANTSGAASTVRVEEFENLWCAVDCVYDGGVIAGDRRGSTIVDLSAHDGYRILRPGSALDATVATLTRFGVSAIDVQQV